MNYSTGHRWTPIIRECVSACVVAGIAYAAHPALTLSHRLRPRCVRDARSRVDNARENEVTWSSLVSAARFCDSRRRSKRAFGPFRERTNLSASRSSPSDRDGSRPSSGEMRKNRKENNMFAPCVRHRFRRICFYSDSRAKTLHTE